MCAGRPFLIEPQQPTISPARLRGPVGIYIGSNTPAEIAVSGMAQILAAKNGVNLPKEFSMGNANHSAQSLHP